MIDVRVFGESARDLMDVLATMERKPDNDGMARMEGEFSPENFAMLNRALMRAESKLLGKDANEFNVGTECRTPDQRSFDAFMEIVTKASSALRAAEDSLTEPSSLRSTPLSTNCRLKL